MPTGRTGDRVTRLADRLWVVLDGEVIEVERGEQDLRPAGGPLLEQDEVQPVSIRFGVILIVAPVSLKDHALRAIGVPFVREMPDP